MRFKQDERRCDYAANEPKKKKDGFLSENSISASNSVEFKNNLSPKSGLTQTPRQMKRNFGRKKLSPGKMEALNKSRNTEPGERQDWIAATTHETRRKNFPSPKNSNWKQKQCAGWVERISSRCKAKAKHGTDLKEQAEFMSGPDT